MGGGARTGAAGRRAAAIAVRACLDQLDLPEGETVPGWQEPEPGRFVVSTPGDARLAIVSVLEARDYTVDVHTFVARRPEEQFENVYRWLLTQNVSLHGIAFGLDRLGDVYLSGRIPVDELSPGGLDRLLGAATDAADAGFRAVLELGYASAIRREWAWRTSRGESLANLEMFRGLLGQAATPIAGNDDGH
jgi:hypothetical protein